MSWTGFDWSEEHSRFVADLTGDGRADILGCGFDGVWVARNAGDGTFGPPQRVLRDYGTDTGWRVAKHPRVLADLTGDGRPDLVGFGYESVSTALNNGDGTFQPARSDLGNFCEDAGGWRVANHLRFLADLTGDGRADIVGFGQDGVYTALGNGDGTFQDARLVLVDFAPNANGWHVDRHPRFLADVTGDGRSDIIGFGDDDVYVALGKGDGTFHPANWALGGLGYNQGWRIAKHPRFLADLTGDGRADIVAFGDDGMSTALSNGTGGFTNLRLAIQGFTDWLDEDHLRLMVDITRDGRADMIGFNQQGMWTARSNGDGSFIYPGFAGDFGGIGSGWRARRHPRLSADVTGDGHADVVGFGDDGVWTSFGLGNGSFYPAKLALKDFGTQTRNAGFLPVKRAVISLDHLHCYKDGEIGAAEPYLLVAFFKVDGDKNAIGVVKDQAGKDQVGIDGKCTFQGTPGTHGNLGDTTVRDGDDVPVPPKLGRFEVELKPITAAGLGLPEVGFGGFAGVVVALLEENSLSTAAAVSGHQAFNRTVERLINAVLPTLRQDMPELLPPSELQKLKDEVADRIRAAVKGTELATFWRLFNADALIGADLIVADQSREIHARFQRLLPPDHRLLTHDYELTGSIVVETTGT